MITIMNHFHACHKHHKSCLNSHITSVPTKPIEGQKTGTSGLRKKSLFNSLPSENYKSEVLVLGGDGRCAAAARVAISDKSSLCFCGETEEEHADTLSLVMVVGYDMVYMFAYSMREKKHAHRNNADDVPEEVKQRRLAELIEAFRESTGQCYDSQVGTIQVVLVEGSNRRAPDTELIEKSDKGHKVAFVNLPLLDRDDQTNNKRNPVIAIACGSRS
ncbi:hypothetical protein HRI_001767400 [Hibiscus trionum]|uniref:Uncharacterized protein n=1 Tax=Hibiscus trionum TaxID=183268 RepID=A0A9W7HPV1_HIBTR|nr:hypothetical protein HRI_001767400 [Hibiscus trionum]